MDLIKALASPAAPSVPESRQLVVDASAMDDMMQQIAESVTPWQARTDSDDEGNVLDTVEHGEEVDNVNGPGLDATRVIELLQKAASPIDSTVQSAYETRTIDSASLQNVYDKLIPLLSPSAASAADTIVSTSSKRRKRDPPRSTALAFRAAAMDQDDALHDAAVGDRAEPCTTAAEGGQVAQAAVLGAGDDVVGADRRLTCDASMFRDLVLAASSPANDSVPEERRVVVDRDAMRNMCDVVVKTSGIRASAGDTASALGATNDAKIPEYISPLSASAKQNGRRGTIDPESLMNMLKLTMLSPAMSLVAASTPSQAAAASSEKREPGDARRTTIDPAQFEDLLAQITSATKPGVGAEEDVAESALKVSSTPREVSSKRRDTIDGADFAALVQRTIGTPFSAGVPAARRTSSAKKCRSGRDPANSMAVSTSISVAAGRRSFTSSQVEGGGFLEVDADAMLNLLLHVKHAASPAGTPLPVQLEGSPYVSPPVSAHTRSAKKQPNSANASTKRRRDSSASVRSAATMDASGSLASLGNTKYHQASGNVRRDSLQGDLSDFPLVSTSAKKPSQQRNNPASSRKSFAAVGTVADVLSLAQDDVTVGSVSSIVTTATSGSTEGAVFGLRTESHQLKSCISSKKAGKGVMQETPRKAVVFGAPAAAEFRRSDPSSALTPMHQEKAQAWFPINPHQGHSGDMSSAEEEDGVGLDCGESVTKVNSRILAAWGDSNNVDVGGNGLRSGSGLHSMNPPGSRGSRRSSGRFKAQPVSALVLGNNDRDCNGSANAPMSVDSMVSSSEKVGAKCDGANSSIAKKTSRADSMKPFQSRIDMVASPSEGSLATTVGGSEAADDSQTEELEANLGAMVDMGGGVADAFDAMHRASLGSDGDDTTVELEQGLLDVISASGNVHDNQEPRNIDETIELEPGLADLISGVAIDVVAQDSVHHSLQDASYTSARSRNKPRLSFSQEGTVELETALSELVAGTCCTKDANTNLSRSSTSSAAVQPMLQHSLLCAAGSPAPRRSLTAFLPPRAPSTAASRNNSSLHSVTTSNSCDPDNSPQTFPILGGQDANMIGSNDGLDLLNSSNSSLAEGGLGICALLETSSTSTADAERQQEDVATESETPLLPHLAEFEELLCGLGLAPASVDSGEPALGNLLSSSSLFPYAMQVECEVIEESCVALANDISPEASDEMARRLWNHAKSVRSANADTSLSSVNSDGNNAPPTHVLEMLLIALRRCNVGGDPNDDGREASMESARFRVKVTAEETQLVETAMEMVLQIKSAAAQDWSVYELDLVGKLEERFVEATGAVFADGRDMIAAQRALEHIDEQCSEALALSVAAKENATARGVAAKADAGAALALTELAAREEELVAAKESIGRFRSRSGALAAVREEVQNLSSLRAEEEILKESAAVALDKYRINEALRSWRPRTLSAEQGAIIVELPLLHERGHQQQHNCWNSGSSLRVSVDCNGRIASALQVPGSNNDAVHRIQWEVVQQASGIVGEERATKRPRIPLQLQRESGKDRMQPYSAAVHIQTILVRDWMGEEVKRLEKQPLKDVPLTLNRLDALVGRLRLAVEEVRAIEDMGLEVSIFETHSMVERFEDSDDDMTPVGGAEPCSREVWLHVPVSSVKHHCQVRLEVRIVDGYPWAPAQVRFVPILGSVPEALRREMAKLADKMVQYGTPIVAGWNAISEALRSATELL